MRSSFQNRWQVVARCGFALLLFQCCGCAHVAVVKLKPARLPKTFVAKGPLESANKYLAAAKHEQPLPALGHDLLAAKIFYGELERRSEDKSARDLYNFAVARTLQDIEQSNLQPWRHPAIVATDEGNYILSSPKPIDAEHDPSQYDRIPTDTLKIAGRFFENHSTTDGFGAPIVAVRRSENARSRAQYAFHRTYVSVTAILRFSGRNAELEFMDPLNRERITAAKYAFPLAADFDASVAMLIAREHPERLGFSRTMNPDAYADTTRLFRLQHFDPAKTPVIFVHGLQDTPAGWAPMINALRDDPSIREHYQFWVFSYPSGYPYPYSAALFRRNLDGIERAFPNHKRIVLIGHSMGGLICRLMVTDSGDKIWRSFFATAPARTPLNRETRHILEEALVFRHRSEVERVVFIRRLIAAASSPRAGSAGSALLLSTNRSPFPPCMPRPNRS